MKNWKTTLLGGLVAVIIAVQPILETGVIDWSKIGMAGLISLLGFLAKDFDQTGLPK